MVEEVTDEDPDLVVVNLAPVQAEHLERLALSDALGQQQTVSARELLQ